MVPPAAPSRIVQFTDLSLAPVTVAVNCWLPFVGRLTEEGDIVTETAANARDGARLRIAARRIKLART
jgi:hypothetical protein